MTGPKGIGYWSSRRIAGGDTEWGILRSGAAYRVTRAFTDFNNDEHPVGERWAFLAYSFLPHDSGWQLFVTFDGSTEYAIPLWLTAEGQGEIERNLADYIAPAD